MSMSVLLRMRRANRSGSVIVGNATKFLHPAVVLYNRSRTLSSTSSSLLSGSKGNRVKHAELQTSSLTNVAKLLANGKQPSNKFDCIRSFSTAPTPSTPSSSSSSTTASKSSSSTSEVSKKPEQNPYTDNEILISGALAFFGIGSANFLHHVLTCGSDMTLLIGGLGASAVLAYGFPQLPFSQPKNIIGGHLFCAATAITTRTLLEMVCNVSFESYPHDLGMMYLLTSAPVAVCLSLMGMMRLKIVHPPAGGTALALATAVPGSLAYDMGYLMTVPTLIGSSSLVACAYIGNKYMRRKGPGYPAGGKWW